MLRNFKQIYEQDARNKVKTEFRDAGLKTNIKQDDQLLVNLMHVTPMKTEVIPSNYEMSIVANKVACGDARDQKENMDRDFGHMW